MLAHPRRHQVRGVSQEDLGPRGSAHSGVWVRLLPLQGLVCQAPADLWARRRGGAAGQRAGGSSVPPHSRDGGRRSAALACWCAHILCCRTGPFPPPPAPTMRLTSSTAWPSAVACSPVRSIAPITASRSRPSLKSWPRMVGASSGSCSLGTRTACKEREGRRHRAQVAAAAAAVAGTAYGGGGPAASCIGSQWLC